MLDKQILVVEDEEDILELVSFNLKKEGYQIKYSDNNSKVHVMAGRENEETAVSVRDFGVGIAKEHLPRLFERFYRTDKARSRTLGGTGLGLAIVKHIVQVHEGIVTVDSTPGEYTVFTIRIPETRMA